MGQMFASDNCASNSRSTQTTQGQSRRRRVTVRRTSSSSDAKNTKKKEAETTSAHPANEEASTQLVPLGLTSRSSHLWREDDNEQSLELPFSTRRPRDFGAGLSSGLKSVAKGVGLGVASLVAAPAYGAVQEGVGGFIKGLGAGVVMAVALPVTGVGIGIAQAARGVINTPEAVMERRAGKKWDKEKREWREHWYSLEADIEELKQKRAALEAKKSQFAQAASQKSSSSSLSPGDTKRKDGQDNKKVADTYYYDLLGVQPNASQGEIRKMYYKLARECHPDKHPDDPDANTKFQALGDAYQVLADPQRRERYNLHGKGATEDMPVVESKVIFAMLFGAEELEPFTGRLRMVTMIEAMDTAELSGKLAEEIVELEQKEREAQLAFKLRERLSQFVDGTEEERAEWQKAMAAKAQALCKHAFGDAMVEAIGWTYENYSTQFLGKLDTFLGLGGRYAKFQAKNREMSNFWRVAGTAVRASLAARRMSKINDRADKAKKVKEQREADAASKATDRRFSSDNATTEESPADTSTAEEQRAREEGAKQLEETLPLLFGTMLQICLLDIEATVRKAAKKVLKDMATPLEKRREEASALIELGHIFQQEAEQFRKEHKDDKIDVLRHMEDAYIRATAEADKETQKHTSSDSASKAPSNST